MEQHITGEELWKSIKGFSNYEVSNQGRVKNIKSQKIMTGWLAKSLYITQMTDDNKVRKGKAINLLVAENFVENPNNFIRVQHKDQNLANNNYKNLIWVKNQKFKTKNPFLGSNIEEWKSVTNNLDYEISDAGNIRNKCTKQIIKPTISAGYFRVSLGTVSRKSYRVHVLIAKTFIPNPENKLTVDHIDKNKLNNNINNLRWATAKEQCQNRDCKGGVKISQERRILKLNGNIFMKSR